MKQFRKNDLVLFTHKGEELIGRIECAYVKSHRYYIKTNEKKLLFPNSDSDILVYQSYWVSGENITRKIYKVEWDNEFGSFEYFAKVFNPNK